MQTVAAVSTGPEKPFELQDLDIDEPRADELLVRIEAVGICHTDLGVKGRMPEGSAIVLGHEGAGVVQKVGSAVTDVHPGDKVLLSFASCGECRECSAGHPGYCARFGELNTGGARADGSTTLYGAQGPVVGSFFGQSSFAHHALTARRNAVVVDAALDLTLTASFGCGVLTGAGAVINVLRPGASDRLVVFGLGGVGMAAVMAGANLGAEQVIGVDLAASRREAALEVGATDVLDGADPELLDKLRDITDGGATRALDTTAVPQVIRTAGQALDKLGVLVLVGVGGDATFDVMNLIGGGKTVRGCIEGDADPQVLIPQLIEWFDAGRWPMKRIVTTFPFADINEAVRRAKDGSAIKPVLVLPR